MILASPSAVLPRPMALASSIDHCLPGVVAHVFMNAPITEDFHASLERGQQDEYTASIARFGNAALDEK